MNIKSEDKYVSCAICGLAYNAKKLYIINLCKSCCKKVKDPKHQFDLTPR